MSESRGDRAGARRPGIWLRLTGWLVAAYVRLIRVSTRWRWDGRAHLEAAYRTPAFIGATWHGRIFQTATLRPADRRAVALVSANRDGDFLAAVLGAQGADAVRGSSRDPRKKDKAKGGAAAVPKLALALREGAIVVMTPDGPRGPAMRAKPGVALVAAAAGAPVIPVGCAFSSAVVLKTWDSFMLPLPFGRGAWVFGPLIAPADPTDASAVEAKRLEIETALIAATRRADALVGRETPAPGPALTLGTGTERAAEDDSDVALQTAATGGGGRERGAAGAATGAAG